MQRRYDAFLSHASTDTQTARLIRGYFRSHNINAWFDADHRRVTALHDEGELNSILKSAIECSRFFIVIISNESIDPVKSPWVTLEVEYAQQQAKLGKIQGIIGIQIDETDLSCSMQKPKWVSTIEIRKISSQVIGDYDRLSKVRDEIGKSSPTYIDDVRPNFIKQIKKAQFSDHLTLCEGSNFDFWHLNGGYSVSEYITPAFNEIIEQTPDRIINGRILLLDSLTFGNSANEEDAKFEQLLQDRLKYSNFYKKEGVHYEQVIETIKAFREISNRHQNINFEFKLTTKIPAARITIFGCVGFFSPYMQEDTSALYFLVFDENSPLFQPTKKYFDDAWEQSRACPF